MSTKKSLWRVIAVFAGLAALTLFLIWHRPSPTGPQGGGVAMRDDKGLSIPPSALVKSAEGSTFAAAPEATASADRAASSLPRLGAARLSDSDSHVALLSGADTPASTQTIATVPESPTLTGSAASLRIIDPRASASEQASLAERAQVASAPQQVQLSASRAAVEKYAAAKAAPAPSPDTPMTMQGCVARDAAAITFTDSANGSRYRLSGSNVTKFLGQPVQIVGIVDTRRLWVVGGFFPSPNVAAQAGAIDPGKAAGAPIGDATAKAATTELPTINVTRISHVSGECRR